MNIEQLAIEHGAQYVQGSGDFCFMRHELEAFAKALQQQSEPVLSKSVLKRHAVQTNTVTIDRAEYEATKADAERYRWLKDNGRANSKNAGNAVYPKFGLKAIFSFHYWTDDLDQAIDQARKI